MYRSTYLPSVDWYVSWQIGRYSSHMSTEMCWSTYRLTYLLSIGGYVDWQSTDMLVNMSTNISVKGCTKYTCTSQKKQIDTYYVVANHLWHHHFPHLHTIMIRFSTQGCLFTFSTSREGAHSGQGAYSSFWETTSLCSLVVFKQFEGAREARKPWGAWERGNWETACTDGRYFLLVQYAGVWAISIGSEG